MRQCSGANSDQISVQRAWVSLVAFCNLYRSSRFVRCGRTAYCMEKSAGPWYRVTYYWLKSGVTASSSGTWKERGDKEREKKGNRQTRERDREKKKGREREKRNKGRETRVVESINFGRIHQYRCNISY